MRVLVHIAFCGLLVGGMAYAQRGGGGVRGGGFGGGSHGGFSGGIRGGAGVGGIRGGGGGGGIRGGPGIGVGGGIRGGPGIGVGGGIRGGYGFRNYGYRGYGGYYGTWWPWAWSYPYGSYSYGYWPGYYGYWPDSWGYYDYPYTYYAPYAVTSASYGTPAVNGVYPPQQPLAEQAHPVTRDYDQYGQEIRPPAPATSSSPIYLLAFQDHVIRAAASYWVDGRTLHYVTLQHEEKQAPLDIVDRALTLQLNRERRVPFNLPQ